MAVRGSKNPFPDKKKLKSGVFTTPQKLDPPPASLSGARKVAKGAMKNTNDKNGQ